MNPLIAWQLVKGFGGLIMRHWRAAAMFILVLLACLTTHKCTADHYKLQMERKDRAAAVAMVKASEQAREQEHKWAAAYDLAVTIEQQETTRVRTQKDRIIAGLRAGTHRLSIAPACLPQAAADTPAATAGAEGGQPGLAGEELVARLAVCDEVTLERNLAVSLMRADRQ